MRLPASRLRPCCTLVFTFLLVLPCLGQLQYTPIDGSTSALPGRSRFLTWTVQDASAMLQMPSRRTPLYLAGVSMALWQTSQLDGGLNPRVRQLQRQGLKGFFEFTNHLGGPEMNRPMFALFAVSLLTPSRRFQDAAFTSLQSMLYAGGLSYGLKYAFGRMRPHDRQGTHHFYPFSGHTSFPSGHTTTAFAILTPWVYYYRHPVTYGLYALATGTAMARMARDKHWGTDVLAGAAIGLLTGRWLAHRHQGTTNSGRWRLKPVIAPNALAITLTRQR